MTADRHAGKTSINVPLPHELVARLNAVCRERLIGRNLVVQRAIEEILDRLEAQKGV